MNGRLTGFTGKLGQTETKRLLALGDIVFAGCLFAETVDEAYTRLSSYRSLWETNTVAYYKTVRAISDPACAVVNGKWFVDFLAYPDISDTNRLDDVIWTKGEIILLCLINCRRLC